MVEKSTDIHKTDNSYDLINIVAKRKKNAIIFPS